MSYKNVAQFDTLKSAAFGSITNSYSAIGTPLTYQTVFILLNNSTNGDVIVSTDGVNDNFGLAAGQSSSIPVTDCSPPGNMLVVQEGTQFFVKQGVSAPSAGSFYISAIGIVEADPGSSP